MLLLFSACGKPPADAPDSSAEAISEIPSEDVVESAYTVFFSEIVNSADVNSSTILAHEIDLNSDGILDVLYMQDGRPKVLTYKENAATSYEIQSDVFLTNECKHFYFDTQKGVVVVRDDGTLKSNFNRHGAEFFQFGIDGLSSVEKLDGTTDGVYDLSTDIAYESAKKSSLAAFDKQFAEATKDYQLTDFSKVAKDVCQLYGIEKPEAMSVASLE